MVKVLPVEQLLLLSVGNTRTRLARVVEGKLQPAAVLENADLATLDAGVAAAAADLPSGESAVLIASVNDAVADRLGAMLTGKGPRVYRFGPALPVPMIANVPEPESTGVDRLLAAVGAFARSAQACVIIDAGTAITVDFVDQWGAFQGGCIAPGLKMMLRSLHEGTARLPLVETPREPPAEPLGRTTTQAMQRGCVAALVGMARLLIDQYAEMNKGYPRIVATGGDAPLLFEGDDVIEHVVPDLVLLGMLESWNRLCVSEE
ncbi:MAG: type III pantothenate kinase [Phycisphaerales bacterium]